ncbi:UPF0488 protein C8orf33 homolog [Triplophysa dalaica]|uniref:UPF0488 protein C8orf33 homolog n=1 Tax=Triplophysa dalaica TaxID=1582913 RepID=UPI0024E037D1|nr:UPF0488 protein C8orf33 homolog [Triplophysa dalaica]
MTEKSNETGTLGMLQNDKNTVVQRAEIENPVIQSSEDTAKAKTMKEKKKKKKAREGKDNHPKETKSTTGETSKQESTELTPDEQLSRELDWCIEQLELGLKTQKTSSKQREEASRALKTLHSSKAPLVKKRQVMRAISGDYRKKMEEERARQFKLIQSTMSSAQVRAVSEVKSVFHQRAERNTESTDKTDRGPQETKERTPMAEKSQGETKPFVFTKTQEQFCFNFNL